MPTPNQIIELIERFEQNIDAYRSGKYNETQVRREFIDPFFELLGWDIANKQGYAEAYKEVVHEDAVKVGWETKSPDYSFRIGGVRKFFLEAKKPSVNIKYDIHPAFQLRRYAWSAKLPLSILTDFEEFAVYDCRVKPIKTDKASSARVMYFTYKDYEKCWDEIESIFSHEAILKGSFDKYAESNKKKHGTEEVDNAFLKEIEHWRELLARNFALRNSDLSNRTLNEVVQKTIDRIVFLRICEDRGMEHYGQLQKLLNGTNVYSRLAEIFLHADDKYNSGLFYFSSEKGRESPDEISLELSIDDKPLKEIIKHLYYPDSPYVFSEIPADILGQVYEQFLGKVIRLTPGHQAKIEDKPEVKKSGGIYYTPTYIVDYIVENTVGKLLEGKIPKKVEKLKILDPACGSGSFLIGAYKYLLDWYLKQYTSNSLDKHSKGRNPKLYQIHEGEWRLTTNEKKRILLNNIYGVDIDTQAVEVTKLSLLLKVLEGETDETLQNQMKLFQDRALPDLVNNIKCGNSLIGSDFYEDRQVDLLDEEEMYRINAFDWGNEFPDIIQSEMSKFHHITFETKYSRDRALKDAVKGKHDSTMNRVFQGEIQDTENTPLNRPLQASVGKPVILKTNERAEVAKAICEVAKKNKFKVLACSILPDHVHMVIADMGEDIKKIVNNIKGYSSFHVNRTLKGTVQGGGRQLHLWSKSFNDSYLNNEEHLFKAINYAQNNYLKHEEIWGTLNNKKVDEILNDVIVPFRKWEDFEYTSGGFDAVIGNPPWIDIKGINPTIVDYYFKTYNTTENRINVYAIFVEISLNLLKDMGIFGFIIPNSILMQSSYQKLRKKILENFKINNIIRLPDRIFQKVKAETIIITISNQNVLSYDTINVYLFDRKSKINKIEESNECILKEFEHQTLFQYEYNTFNIFINHKILKLIEKISKFGEKLQNICDFTLGITPYDKYKGHTQAQINNRVFHANEKKDDTYRKLLSGEDINRYKITWKSGNWLSYGPWLAAPRESRFFRKPRILVRQIVSGCPLRIFASYTEEELYNTQIAFNIILKNHNYNIKYILGIINSSLINYYHKNKYLDQSKGLFQKILIQNARQFPIRTINFDNIHEKQMHDKIVYLVEQMLEMNKRLDYVQTQHEKELLKRRIDATDRHIDKLVYELYGLTEEEIKIVEKSA